MNAKQAKYPQLRFKGFTDPWEKCKLGDLVDINTGNRNHQDSVINGKYDFYVRSEKIEHLNEYDFDEEAILVPGDGRIGQIFHYVNGKFALHQRVYKVDNFNLLYPKFLLQLFNKSFREHALKENAQGTVPSLRKPVFTNWIITIPKIEEQTKIGTFFKQLDDTIALHQRKLAKLKKLKQGYLQKMFPQNGSKFPQLRFAGFADAWEQRKLGESCRIGDIDHRMPKSVTEGVPYLMTGDFIGENKLNFENTKLVSIEDYDQLSKKIKPEYGDILFARYASVGAVRYVDIQRKFLISYSCAIMKPNIDIKGLFLYQLLQTDFMKRKIEFEINPNSQKNIGIDSLKKLKISIPIIEEQEKIGKFFKDLDNTIALHQRKLEKLQELKKGYLQKIFC